MSATERALACAIEALGLDVDVHTLAFSHASTQVRDLQRRIVIMDIPPAMMHAGRMSSQKFLIQKIYDTCSWYAELVDIWEGKRTVIWA